ncbi:glycoside hydrolase family 3 protein [Paenibacillus brevis]|uniref:Glycoside hydrolase family 3 C-terminal domain-containing protein n=1 Tax=Paenibacillus brevis TaxID=2841508 RepID=A0ABS6FQ43_9BACL|nr:glycoside hydrolase family 3 protein [Paenibacillus brevis]MBU5672308.1 glycoside hydrolase family 3 C-terminal domain-containing protein [Paenibacillus brevis]
MNFPFQNADLPLEERVNDLVSRFTLDEKIELMCQYQSEIPRLGVKKYKHGTEGAHGVAWLGEATVFPQNIGLACTWDPDLMHEIGSVISEEARIYYQRDPAVNGLTVWAPTVDMERDPRWGRTEEAYGEDPHLTGRLSTELVKGMQGDHPFYYKTVATLKHFYGNNNEIDRGSASVSIDPRNKREYYLKAFEPAFREGKAGSMMTAYNGINGTPCNLNHEVNEIVKKEWGMDGFVVGDAGDVLGTVMDHGYVQSYAEAVAGSVKAGIDSITDEQDISFRALRDALEQGLLEESDLDHALRNTFRVRFRLGEFDPVDRNPYSHVPESKLCAPEHADLSRKAAQKSVVLLKNNGILPLPQELESIAVLGPLANEAYTDWYSGTPPYRITPLQGIQEKLSEKDKARFHTGLDKVRIREAKSGSYIRIMNGEEAMLVADGKTAESAEAFERNDWGWENTTFRAVTTGKYITEGEKGLQVTAEEARGWFVKESFQLEPAENGQIILKSWEGKPVILDGARLVVSSEPDAAGAKFLIERIEDGIAEAVRAAKASKRAVIFVGNSPFINGKETIDRPDIVLPADQQALIKAVHEANPNTVVAIVGSYPFAVNWEQEHVPAILFTSHSGQELGRAIGDVLFGDYNPAGRLNMTWYKSTDQLADLMDYDIIKGKRTYQYFDGEVLYPFGHGLSYTEFAYEELSLDKETIGADETATVSVLIRNVGDTAGEEVVQLYVRADQSRVTRPLKTLAGFRRVHLDAGEAKRLEFKLPASELAMWDVTRDKYTVERGNYTIMIGSSADSIQADTVLRVDGEVIPPRSLRQPTRAVNYDDYEQVYIDECREGGESIALSKEEGWILFRDVELGTGASSFEARVAGGIKGGGIQIVLDQPDGKAVSELKVIPTGGSQAWTTVAAELDRISGRHDVYLKLQGELRISWLQLN